MTCDGNELVAAQKCRKSQSDSTARTVLVNKKTPMAGVDSFENNTGFEVANTPRFVKFGNRDLIHRDHVLVFLLGFLTGTLVVVLVATF